MVKPRIRRPLVSASVRGAREQSLSTAERQLLPQLLALLRSGALASLLESSGSPADGLVPSQPSPVAAPQVHVESNKSKPKHNRMENYIPGGWTPVKFSKFSIVDGKHKLLPNGWSVPIQNSVAEMSSTAPGVCLASTAEGKKLVNDLKGEFPLAILVPANITGSGEEVHVLVEDPS